MFVNLKTDAVGCQARLGRGPRPDSNLHDLTIPRRECKSNDLVELN